MTAQQSFSAATNPVTTVNDHWAPIVLRAATKQFKNMKLITEEKDVKRFACVFQNEATEFANLVYRIRIQFKPQEASFNLASRPFLPQTCFEVIFPSTLHEGHFYIHMGFADDYRCTAQQEVHPAYWNLPSNPKSSIWH